MQNALDFDYETAFDRNHWNLPRVLPATVGPNSAGGI
jgi:hypothetical protein